MSKHRYGVQEVRKVLDEIVDANPSGVDRRAATGILGPRYVEHGEPVCLVACIMARLGVSLGVLHALDIEPGNSGGGVQLCQTLHPVKRRFTPEAWDLLVFLQRRNDRGWSWQKARTGAFEPDSWGRYQQSWMSQ